MNLGPRSLPTSSSSCASSGLRSRWRVLVTAPTEPVVGGSWLTLYSLRQPIHQHPDPVRDMAISR